MKPLQFLESTPTANGVLTLHQRDNDFLIQLERQELMSSRTHGSEVALAQLAIDPLPGDGPVEILVGGLGMGFTLRAALDALEGRPGSTVTVAEVFPAVVDWNRKYLGVLNDDPLDDPRVRVVVQDVALSLRVSKAWDAILLDVDNGPSAFTLESNGALYERSGLWQIHAALKPGGMLAAWSADADPAFVQRMQKAGFDARARTVSARMKKKGGKHTIFLGKK